MKCLKNLHIGTFLAAQWLGLWASIAGGVCSIPGQEPGGLQSMGSQRIGHDWETNTHTHTHTQLSFSLIKERFLSLLVSQNEPKGIPKGSREFAQWFRSLGLGSFLGPGKGSCDLQLPLFQYNDFLSGKWLQELTSPGTTQAPKVMSLQKESRKCTDLNVLCFMIQTCSKMWRQHCRNNHGTKFS